MGVGIMYKDVGPHDNCLIVVTQCHLKGFEFGIINKQNSIQI